MLRQISRTIVLCATILVSGCANGYQKFYSSVQPGSSGIQTLAFTGEPRLVPGSKDDATTVQAMFGDGYGLVGVSNFIGPSEDTSGALVQAKKIGAAVVAISSQYQNTVSGDIPLTTPTTNTSYSAGTVNTVGSYGSASGTYSGTTTTYGSQTTYIPYSVDRYVQKALYFAPLERRGIGVFFVLLKDEERQVLGTNKAVKIVSVRKNSPAFSSDLVPGDYLLSVNGQVVFDVPSATAALAAARGATEFVIVHRGSKVAKSIDVPLGEWP
jgi:S1-C subfamily serine protease